MQWELVYTSLIVNTYQQRTISQIVRITNDFFNLTNLLLAHVISNYVLVVDILFLRRNPRSKAKRQTARQIRSPFLMRFVLPLLSCIVA